MVSLEIYQAISSHQVILILKTAFKETIENNLTEGGIPQVQISKPGMKSRAKATKSNKDGGGRPKAAPNGYYGLIGFDP